MRVIVTGAAGFIGCHIAAELAHRGHEVIGVDDYSGGTNAPLDVRMFDVDLADDAEGQVAFADVVREYPPEVLVHCAANAREGESIYSPEKITRQNLYAYSRTLRASIAAGKLKRVVCFSSMARYGVGVPPFDERTEPRPIDPYGANKLAMETLTQVLAPVHGYAWTIATPHNVIGEKQRLNDRFRNVAAILMNRLMRGDGEPLVVYGDGEQRRAFSYIGDSLPCFIRMVEGYADGEIVNIGGATPITVNELVMAVKAEFGCPGYPVIHLPDRVAEVKHAWCTVQKSAKLLGYAETIGWRAGLHQMANWAKQVGFVKWNDNEHVELPRGKGLPQTWR